MPNAAKGKFKIGDGVTTIVSITQQGLQGLGADGSIDALLDQQLATVFDTADGAEDIGKRVRGEKSINLMTNNFVQHPYEMKEVSTNKIIPICATIGAPFDQAKYEADEQSVFLVSDFSEISEYKAAALGADPEGTYNISLMNIKTLETQYKYAKVLFTFNDSTTAVSEFSIDMENTSLLGAINAYGAVSGSKRNISLKTDASKLLPFKGTPIDVTNGLSIFADWFDYDVVMP